MCVLEWGCLREVSVVRVLDDPHETVVFTLTRGVFQTDGPEDS